MNGCLARRAQKTNIIAAAIGLLLMPLFFACDSPESTPTAATNSPTDPPIVQPLGHGLVQVQIENLKDRAATLDRIDGNQISEFQRLEPVRGTQTIKLPSGFYTLGCDNNRIRFPVPAIASMLGEQPISISIVEQPEPESHWCWIPPGPAIIGDTLGVGREDERPARVMDVPGFWLCDHEATNAEYAKFLNEQNPIEDDWIDFGSRKCRIKQTSEGSFEVESENDSNKDVVDVANLPVVMVSLRGAQAYCQWLTNKTNQQYRLPTEIEWEKAARGPESFVYSYGNIYQQSRANQESGKLKPIKSYAPNGWGLYDMTGNVFEWMSDVADISKSETTLNHSLRGGSFVLDGMYLRNSFRMRQSPGVMTDDIGFRVARDPK